MPSVETRPYLSCAADVVVGDGWIHDRGGLPEALPPQLTEWDPGQDIVLRRTLNVDAPRVRQMCGLGTGATILLSVSWRSAGSGQRVTTAAKRPRVRESGSKQPNCYAARSMLLGIGGTR